MKKNVFIVLSIIGFITIIFFSSIKATEFFNKSLQYDVVVKDKNGVTLKGSYKDNKKNEKIIDVNIPENTKLKVLYEYEKDGILYGHIKYNTTITVRSDGTVVDGTSGYTGSIAPTYRGTTGASGLGYYNYYGSSGYGVGNAVVEEYDEGGNYNNESDTTNSNEGGNYNNESDTTNSNENGNYNNGPDTTNSNENGNYNNVPDTASQKNNYSNIPDSTYTQNMYIDPYVTSGKSISYGEITIGSSRDTSTANTSNSKYTEIKKMIEVEGDIELSKCEVDGNFSLDNAINYKLKRKLMIANKSGVYLYDGPAKAYKKSDSVVPSGTVLKYTYGAVPLDEANKDVMWAYVEYGNNKGWIYKNPLDSFVATYEKGRILSYKSVTIKEYPILNSDTIETLSKDTRKSFTYVYGIQDEENDEWYYIEYKGKKGWVSSVAKGINANITVKNDNGISLYKKPNLDSDKFDVLIPKDFEINSIYKYSKKNDAFYIEYDGYSGWIILEKYEDGTSNFEVTYLDDDVVDSLVDLETEDIKESKNQKNKNDNKIIKIFLIIIGSIILIILITCLIIKHKNKKTIPSREN